MATVQTVIDDINDIATSMVGFGDFFFEELAGVNWENRNRKYPALCIDSQNSVDYTWRTVGTANFPRKKQITLLLFFFDVFKQQERGGKTKQEKYGELEVVADQFLAELVRRGTQEAKGYQVLTPEGINGFFADKVHNERLVQLTATVNISINPNCVAGDFTAGG